MCSIKTECDCELPGYVLLRQSVTVSYLDVFY